MKLGEKQVLTVVKQVDFGVYLGSEKDKVLLPKRQVPKDVEVGDPVEVFLYKDSDDRLIATTEEPLLMTGQTAVLKVKEVGKFGAFLDWGLSKDLFLPFKEQTVKVEEGKSYLTTLYIDKSERLCATMKVYNYLKKDSPYKKDDHVKGIIYEISEGFGVFAAVDNIYSALIPKKEAYGNLQVGMTIDARVTAVKEDGKLDLSIREKIPVQMDKDAGFIMAELEKRGGSFPFTDKADVEIIKREFGMSKNAFKRAIGRLLKDHKVEIGDKSITAVKRIDKK